MRLVGIGVVTDFCFQYYELHYLVLPMSRHLLLPPPPLHKPKTQNQFWGREVTIVMVT